MRTFIAIELPESVRTAVHGLSLRLRGSGVHATWVRPENLHLTLRFLGEVDAERVERLRGILTEAFRGATPLMFSVRGTGAFPSARRPSVIWVGLEALQGDLPAVQTAAEAAARTLGLPPEEKAFHPHVTLARIKDSRAAGPLIELLEAEGDFAAGEFTADRVSLLSSELTRQGPVYRRLEEFPF